MMDKFFCLCGFEVRLPLKKILIPEEISPPPVCVYQLPASALFSQRIRRPLIDRLNRHEGLFLAAMCHMSPSDQAACDRIPGGSERLAALNRTSKALKAFVANVTSKTRRAAYELH